MNGICVMQYKHVPKLAYQYVPDNCIIKPRYLEKLGTTIRAITLLHREASHFHSSRSLDQTG
jgi:hypothetical protein